MTDHGDTGFYCEKKEVFLTTRSRSLNPYVVIKHHESIIAPRECEEHEPFSRIEENPDTDD